MDNAKGEPIDDYTRRIARILHDAQERSELSFRDLEEATGLSLSTVDRVLNGKRNITANYLKLICDALGLSPAAVLDEADE